MDIIGLPDDMWSPFKHIFRVVHQTLTHPSIASLNELELCLKKYKQNFENILRNPPKNERSRAQLRMGITEGITLPGRTRSVLLSKDLVDEALILSDMYDLDEYVALNLLCTAQGRQSQHPGLPRGLIAILLYYDGRKAIACALRDLFQVIDGVSWDSDTPKEVTYLVSIFVKSLVEEYNILDKIIVLLDELDIVKENELLTKNRAYGPKKHQNQVLELFDEIRLALAMTLFNWSGQRGLPKTICVKLIHSLARNKSTEASGAVDDVTYTLLMALIYGYDTSVLLRQEDNNERVQNLPVMSEPDFAQTIYDTLIMEHNADTQNNLLLIAKFAFALSLTSLRHAPSNVQNSLSQIIEQDEQLMEDAISHKLFEILYYFILDKDIIYKTEFFYRRIHLLFTDFIDFMHSKVTELRGRADETARTMLSFIKEGLEPPGNLDHSFEMLMMCIGKFYKDNRAGLSLCTDYWGPIDMSAITTKATTRSVSLFKFIRLAGELLPSTLFVPYLNMIAGLTSCERSARSAFNLLKQVNGLAGSAALSWEHFFGSLMRYYTNLRQEQNPGYDTIYRNRLYNRNINPKEIEGIHAVLSVIKAVATYDEIARIAMCEHPSWATLHVLLGLLSCSVPLNLKAQLLETLAALCKSKETAVSLWQNLETSQIIATIPTTNTYSACNLEIEIEQNECRDETYPVTRGILDLLYSLITTIVPKNLGSGPRKPGLDPYVTFIVNGIFLKFYNRSYKNPAEKWEVGEKCLKLLHHMLQTYEVNPQDFDIYAEQNPHPGFHVMLQLQVKSDILRLILLIIDDVRNKLDEYSKFYGKKTLEICASYCLNILDLSLAKQDIFFDAHLHANSSTVLSGLNRMLLDVNPRSQKPDHILNTTKFITYSSWLPGHALTAIRILIKISKLPNIQTQILAMFTQNERIQNEIRHGFVECLESELMPMENGNEEDITDAMNPAKVEVQIKESIIELLHNCLVQPPPNLSQFLLGFDAQRDILLSQKQKLTAIDAPSNCTKSLICMLDNHLESRRNSDIYDIDMERIVEHAYKLLYSLCINKRTTDTILRYLRSWNDFIQRHLAALPFKNADRSGVLNQMSYLLKCTAIELKVTATNCQISRFQHLCDVAVGVSDGTGNENITIELNNFYMHAAHLYPEASLLKNSLESSSNMMLYKLLDLIVFESRTLEIPEWDFFDSHLITEILKECEMKTSQGHKLVDIKKLHEILNEELRSVQSTIASGQRKLILQEIEGMLVYALKINDQRNRNNATVKLMEAWCQVIEILYTCAPDAALSIANRQVLIMETLQKLLSKIVPNQTNNELSILASGTVLVLLVNLRYLYMKSSSTESTDKMLPIGLDTEADKLQIPYSAKTNSLSLKFILENILEWLIISGVGSQKLHINLYSSLLNILIIVKETETPTIIPIDQRQGNNEEFDSYDFYVSRLDKTKSDQTCSHQVQMTIAVFKSFGEKLMDLICNDSISGHEICKMNAMTCIISLFDLDVVTNFIEFILNHGYLTHFIKGLLESDDDLCRALCLMPENLKSLYTYESKMIVLLKIAESKYGAEVLLMEQLLETLAAMKVYDMHPDYNSSAAKLRDERTEFMPTVDVRYRQVLFPALHLCEAMLNSLRLDNISVNAKVLNFILAHCEMFEMVLRSSTPYMELGLLQELVIVTRIIARIANQELYHLQNWCSEQHIIVKLHRIQRFMLNNFKRFLVSESTVKQLFRPENMYYEPTEANKSVHVKLYLEIASNLSLYCHNTTADHSVEHRSLTLLFTPTSTKQTVVQFAKDNADGQTVQRPMSIGVLIEQLRGTVEYFNAQKTIADNLIRQRTALPNLTFDSSAKSTYIELTQRHMDKQNELALCALIVQICLKLLWNHLELFMGKAFVPMNSERTPLSDILYENEVTQNVIGSRKEDIIQLKKDLIMLFNEIFCKKLIETTITKSAADKCFNETLLRRIKNLIQFVEVD